MTAADPAVAELIREVLAEELAGVCEERVRVANDADLAAFAKRVLALADNRKAREAFENGKLVFRLDSSGAAGSVAGAGTAADGVRSGGAGKSLARGVGGVASGSDFPSSPAASGSSQAMGHTEVIERGLLSERQVDRLPRETTRVRIGRNVTMTPLARDRLRRRGIAIERAQ